MNENKKPNKRLGQHFLKDQKTIQSILNKMPKNTDLILEIGPGLGAITEHLSLLQKKIILIEKDPRFVKLWQDRGLECIEDDALDIQWKNFLSPLKRKGNIWLVSNLPYNISAPLTIKLLQCSDITSMTLMYQKEVAEKILGTNGTSSLHQLCTSYFSIEKVAIVKPGGFTPPPKVDSMVLNFEKKSEPTVPYDDFQRFEQFLRKLFAFPRKQLGSVLSKFITKELSLHIQTMQIDLKIRAEKLKSDQVLKLYQVYSSSLS